MYVKSNVIFTSRGCNNNCGFCGVPKIEGKIRELPVVEGNIIQDNNFLQCSRAHKDKVFEMLKSQSGICFKGGLQTSLIDDYFINGISDLRVKELWLACDSDSGITPLRKAVEKLQEAGYNRNKIYCYALIGDDMAKNEARLMEIFNIGAMPFAQLKQEFEDEKTKYSKEWNAFSRQWQRPAAITSHCLKGTDFHNFST